MKEGVFVTYGSSLQPVFEKVVSLRLGREGGKFELKEELPE